MLKQTHLLGIFSVNVCVCVCVCVCVVCVCVCCVHADFLLVVFIYPVTTNFHFHNLG